MSTENEQHIKAAIERGLTEVAQDAINYCPSNIRGQLSDGYHTFNELYEHRITLFIALCKFVDSENYNTGRIDRCWKMTPKDGWFLMGIGTDPGKQITYHLPESKWEETSFAIVIEEKEFVFDEHTSADVLERLKNL